MSIQRDEELFRLRDDLLLMGGIVESMLFEAKEALEKHSPKLARQVIDRDEQVDQMEKELDERAISILALRQPAASDLRFVAAALKIITEVERMGDVIRNICERILELEGLVHMQAPDELMSMFDKVHRLTGKCLDAFVKTSSDDAGRAVELDREIDEINRRMHVDLINRMKQEPQILESTLKYLYISKHLERISDHAVNIAEQVVFVEKGLDIRHTRMPTATPYEP